MKIVELILSSFRHTARKKKYKNLSFFERDVLAKKILFIDVAHNYKLNSGRKVNMTIYAN